MALTSPENLQTELRQLADHFSQSGGRPVEFDAASVEAIARHLNLCAEMARLMAEEIVEWRQMGQLATARPQGRA